MINRELKDFQPFTAGDPCREHRIPGMSVSQLSPKRVNCVMIRSK